MNAQGNEGTPILATIVGCSAMAVLPLLLLAGVVYSGYMYFETKDQAELDEVEKQRAYEEHLRAQDQAQGAGQAFNEAETRELRRQLSRMASEDEGTRRKAWNVLSNFKMKNPAATWEMLSAEYAQNTNLQFVAQVTYGLCIHFHDQGRQAVLDKAAASAQDKQLLEAIAQGVDALHPAERDALRPRILRELIRAGSPHIMIFATPKKSPPANP